MILLKIDEIMFLKHVFMLTLKVTSMEMHDKIKTQKREAIF